MTRIGIIGAGPNAAGHAKYYAASGRAKVVAVADPDAARAEALSAEVGGRALADFNAFLPDVDAVVVSSPNFLHRDHAIAAARAGRHVFCEKPMGLGASDARAIAAAVESAGVCSMVGFSPRFDAPQQTAARMVEAGRLGPIATVWSRRLFYMGGGLTGWRGDHARSGGLLMEINVHELEWMMSVGGEVESVYCAMRTAKPQPSPRANDHLMFILNFAGGAIGSHDGSWLMPCPMFARAVCGTEGAVCTDEWGTKLFHAAPGGNRQEVPLEPKLDLRGHWLACIEGKATPVADVRWGLKVMVVAEALLRSAATNQVVRVAEV